jgi:beta-glucosidase
MAGLLAFPAGFRWGAATAAHQNEGDNDRNQWSAWEHQPGRIHEGAASGKATGWWDLRTAAADFDRAAEMGLNSLRLSVEWSRIEPESGVFDASSLDHYRQMLGLLRQRGIEPMVTLHHFTDPLWLTSQGGWENPAVGEMFERFVRCVVNALGDRVTLWCTINEPLVYAFYGYMDGRFPPGSHNIFRTVKVLRNMLVAHGRAYHAIHRLQKDAVAGLAHHMRYLLPANPASAADRRVTRWIDQVANRTTLEAVTSGRLIPLIGRGEIVRELANTSDYIGLNFYSTARVQFAPFSPTMFFARQYIDPALASCDCTPQGEAFCEINPPGIYLALKDLAQYGKPIYITESGLPDRDDDQRPYMLATYLAEVQRAIRDGADVRGYYHWTLVDNFEWAAAWALRFGLIAFDPATGERTPRQSAAVYSRIVAANGVPESLMAQVAPEAVSTYFGVDSAQVA